MVNLFFEIKRNLPHKLREPLKISNPDLGDALIDLYHTVDDQSIKRLIEVFLERAKEDWSKKLKPSSKLEFALLKKDSSSALKSTTNTKTDTPKVRYYRGAPIEV